MSNLNKYSVKEIKEIIDEQELTEDCSALKEVVFEENVRLLDGLGFIKAASFHRKKSS